MRFKKEEPVRLSSAKHGATISPKTLEEMYAAKNREMANQKNPMQERLKEKIGEETARQLHSVRSELELTQKLAKTQGIINDQLQLDNRKQDEVIDSLLQLLLDSGVELPQQIQDLLADRIEKKFFGSQGLEEESKHSMFSGIGSALGGAGGAGGIGGIGGVLGRSVLGNSKAFEEMYETERRAKTRAGW